MDRQHQREMTDAAIERTCERQMDRFDRKLLNGEFTQEQYDNEVQKMNSWAIEQYRRAACTYWFGGK